MTKAAPGQYFALILFKRDEICKLILRKIIKIVATRCYILKLKCTEFGSGGGSAPDPAGEAYHAPPDNLAGFNGPGLRHRPTEELTALPQTP